MAEMRFDTIRCDEQRRRMERCRENGTCYLCERLSNQDSITHEMEYWFVMKNDFPYDGTVHHYLIVSKNHVTQMEEISAEAGSEFFKIVKWLKQHLQNVTGFSIFVRSGDMNYTHASLDHLHFQFLVGTKKTEEVEKIKVTLGYKNKAQ
jgi:diadenosine tetraphosphate (Ap4A) HIT family hydrolase